jgi:hypothetical protein
MNNGDYSELDIQASRYCLDQATKLDESRNKGVVVKTLEELLADADLIWQWMAGQYQPPSPSSGSVNGNGSLAAATAKGRSVGYQAWHAGSVPGVDAEER